MLKENGVLAARVLSCMKRRSGKGMPPSPQEVKAALTALILLSVEFPMFANDPAAMFKKLISVARGSRSDGRNDGISELGEEQMLRMQMVMERHQKAEQMMSNMIKNMNDTQNSVVRNLR